MKGMRVPKVSSWRRSRAVVAALKKEGHAAASSSALAEHARAVARLRGPESRRRSAAKAVATKGAAGLRREALQAARTRAAKEISRPVIV